MTLQAGARLGPYEILALIGAGGMGEVYRARDKKLDRDVAIKVLPQSLAADSRRPAPSRNRITLWRWRNSSSATPWSTYGTPIHSPEAPPAAAGHVGMQVELVSKGLHHSDHSRAKALLLADSLRHQVADGLTRRPASKIMVRNYVESCVTRGIQSGRGSEIYDEFLDVIYRMVR